MRSCSSFKMHLARVMYHALPFLQKAERESLVTLHAWGRRHMLLNLNLRLWVLLSFQTEGGDRRSFLWAERGTSRVLQRNNLIKVQSVPFADRVKRWFVSGWWKLSLPWVVPPTVVLPHFGCLTSVPRLMPSESVPP